MVAIAIGIIAATAASVGLGRVKVGSAIKLLLGDLKP